MLLTAVVSKPGLPVTRRFVMERTCVRDMQTYDFPTRFANSHPKSCTSRTPYSRLHEVEPLVLLHASPRCIAAHIQCIRDADDDDMAAAADPVERACNVLFADGCR
jgi:hypothetical protein